MRRRRGRRNTNKKKKKSQRIRRQRRKTSSRRKELNPKFRPVPLRIVSAEPPAQNQKHRNPTQDTRNTIQRIPSKHSEL